MARRLDEELSFSLEIKKTAAGRAPLLPTLKKICGQPEQWVKVGCHLRVAPLKPGAEALQVTQHEAG